MSRPELEAEIYYLREDEGGRKTPVANNYRGQFHYDGKDWDASQNFIDKQLCFPGETVAVLIRTANPIRHIGKFFVGKCFEIREGTTIVGKGVVTKILRRDFQQ